MAANIDINETTGQANAFYLGRPAWHGLGQVLPEDHRISTVEELLTLSGTNWSVREAPVTYMGQLDGGEAVMKDAPNRVLYRSDTGSHLHTCSETYQVHQHREVAQAGIDALTVAGDMGIDFWAESGFGLSGGKRVVYCFRVGEQMDIGGDEFRPYVFMTTSHDESWATTWKYAAYRLECENMTRAALADKSMLGYKIKHTSGSGDGRWKADIIQGLKLISPAMAAFNESVSKLIDTTITAGQFDRLIAHNFPVKPATDADVKVGRTSPNVRRQAEVRSLYENDRRVGPFKGTAWGYLQAVNTWELHVRGEGTGRSERNMNNFLSDTLTFSNLSEELVKKLVLT